MTLKFTILKYTRLIVIFFNFYKIEKLLIFHKNISYSYLNYNDYSYTTTCTKVNTYKNLNKHDKIKNKTIF